MGNRESALDELLAAEVRDLPDEVLKADIEAPAPATPPVALVRRSCVGACPTKPGPGPVSRR